jgi:hypothetical protein
MRPVFETAGDVRSVDLLASFVTLWRENASGELRFSRSGVSAGFEVSDGEIVASHSSQSQFDVAAILERGGKLDAAAVERLAVPEGTDAAIAALQAGLITVREWRWGQKIRAIEILSDLLGWLEGEYTYDPAARPEAGDWTLPIPRLTLELFLRSRDRTLVEHYLGPSDLPLVRSEHFDEEFAGFGLTSDAGSVIQRIDGKATAEEIAAKAPADEFAVLKLLAALTTLGLIHPQEAAAPRGAEPTPRKKKREAAKAAPSPPPPPIPREEEIPQEPSDEMPAEPAPAESVAPPPEEDRREEEPPPAPEPRLEEEEQEEVHAEPLAPEAAPIAARPVERLPVLPFDTGSTPADLMAEPYEEPVREPEPEPELPPLDRQELGRDLDRYDPPSPPPPPFEPPSAGGHGGWGRLLAALLAILVVAVAVVVVMRTRSRAPGVAASPAGEPTAVQDVPVFPPAETAVPISRRGRRTPTPPPAPAIQTTVASPETTPSPTPRAAAAPTKTPTASPTRPAPTKTPSATATRSAPTRTSTPTRTPTKTRTVAPPTKTPTATRTAPPPTKTRTATPTRPIPTKTFTRTPTRPAPTRTPTAVPTPPPTRRPLATPRPAPATPTKAGPATKPPTRPPAATPVPTPQPAISGTGEAARREWIRRAESDRQALSRRPNARYAVQLELACEIETLEKAWAWDKPAGTMWLLTTQYRGRTCFRVLWGRYATLSQAQAARAKIPSFFVVPGNRPVAVSVR